MERFRTPQCLVTRQTLGLPDEAVVAIYVGRMSGEKNLEQLIAFYRHISDEEKRSHLLLVGGGPDIEIYRALVQSLNLAERVTITGPVDYAQLPDYLALSDFFVTASVSEVHPLTLIEASAAGLPALSSATASTPRTTTVTSSTSPIAAGRTQRRPRISAPSSATKTTSTRRLRAAHRTTRSIRARTPTAIARSRSTDAPRATFRLARRPPAWPTSPTR